MVSGVGEVTAGAVKFDTATPFAPVVAEGGVKVSPRVSEKETVVPATGEPPEVTVALTATCRPVLTDPAGLVPMLTESVGREELA
jgi:hypothetical protein